MPFVPVRSVGYPKIDAAVRKTVRSLKPDVLYIRYSLDQDWSGDPAIFFRVVLSDEASRLPRLRQVSNQVTEALQKVVDLQAYFNFRSKSEQEEMNEEAWA